nr:hypothetical protein [Tanacetum cinerariifolium]
MLKHKEIYVTLSHTKKIFANMKRQGKDSSSKVTPLFETMMVQPQEDMGEDSKIPTDSHHTPIVTQPSISFQPQQKQTSKKSKKRITKIPQLSDSTHDVDDEHITITSNDLILSGEDRMKLSELIELCTQLQSIVLVLETIKADQALEIGGLKRRKKEPEKKASKKTHKLKSLDADEGVALVYETQGRNDQDTFDTSIFDDEEIVDEEVVDAKEVSTADSVTTAGEVVITAGVEDSTAATTTGVEAKDKGKAKMIEPEKPLKRKEQIMINEEVARNLEAQMQAELEEEERLARQKQEEANITLVAEWDNTQAMMDVDCELVARLLEEEREELTIKEKSMLFVELMDKRNKHFARLRAKKIRSKQPTKAQKRNQMCTYLKNMANYKCNQLKNKSFKEIQMLFNNTMKWIDSFVPMDTELVKGSEKAEKGSEKTAKEKLKRCLEIIPEYHDDVTIKATPISSKSPTIVDYKIYKEGRKIFFKIIRADDVSIYKKLSTSDVDDVRLQVDYETKLLIKKLEDSEDSFVPMDTELVKGSEKAEKGSEKTAKEKLKRCLEIIPEYHDDVTIKATPISSKSPTIVDYKIYKEGRKIFFKIIRADDVSIYKKLSTSDVDDVRLQVDYEVEMAYDLLRLIRRQINKGYMLE